MIVTEKEALLKQCVADVSEHCVASGCMAWRQEGRITRGPDYLDETTRKTPVPPDRGFCGLAYSVRLP